MLVGILLDEGARGKAYNFAAREQYKPQKNAQAGGPDIEAFVAMSRCACTHVYTVHGHGIYVRMGS